MFVICKHFHQSREKRKKEKDILDNDTFLVRGKYRRIMSFINWSGQNIKPIGLCEVQICLEVDSIKRICSVVQIYKNLKFLTFIGFRLFYLVTNKF